MKLQKKKYPTSAVKKITSSSTNPVTRKQEAFDMVCLVAMMFQRNGNEI